MPGLRTWSWKWVNKKKPMTSRDIVIIVLGVIGSGRSTFINTAAGETVTAVSDSLEPCTTEIIPVYVTRPSGDDRLVFLDTPGFDETHGDETNVLEMVSQWLRTSYGDTPSIAGIIYLHDITQKRMVLTSSNNFRMFESAVGRDIASKITLVTTMWTEGLMDKNELREQQLSEEYWRPMLDQGSSMRRFEDTYQSAWDIITPLIQ